MKIPRCVNCDQEIKWVYGWVHSDTHEIGCWGMSFDAESDTRPPLA